jgi:hypothetical protein
LEHLKREEKCSIGCDGCIDCIGVLSCWKERWLHRLHRGVKLLEREVATRCHWREGKRRREEVGEILGCGKMRKMLGN